MKIKNHNQIAPLYSSKWTTPKCLQITNAREDMEKVKPTISLMRVYIAAVTIENSMEAPQKLRTELLYDPTISFIGIYIWKK